jgi:hypothetical protein
MRQGRGSTCSRPGKEACGGGYLSRLAVVTRMTRLLPRQLVTSRQMVDRAIYGTVSVIAVIAAASHGHAPAGQVLIFTAASSVVLWMVHVYASVLADTGPAGLEWRPAVQRAIRHEHGVLIGVVIPLGVLSLGTLRLIDDDRAIRWSMWSGVLVLFLTPLVWFRPATTGWGRTLVASLVGGGLGMALISLKVVLH